MYNHSMKQAHLPDGTAVTATAVAPDTAVCPHCGADVVLRHRRRMDGSVVHFWRHTAGRRNCPGRTRPHIYANGRRPAA
jgi:hypothetical protein